MCGRAACTLGKSSLCKACAYKDAAGKRRLPKWLTDDTGDGRGYCPSYNLGPTDVIPCIVAGRHFQSPDEQILHPMIWGMIPRWHKGDYLKHGMKTHNARSERLSSSVLYSRPLSAGQRCVIVCEGYYEWKTTGRVARGVKQPYFIYAQQEKGVKIEDRETWKDEWSEESGWKGIKLLKLAGIFDTWLSPEGKKIYSCSMITEDANATLSWLHYRVPVFLDNDQEVADWLDYERIPLKNAVRNLHGPTNDTVKWHPVDPMVNNSKFKGAGCYQPIVLEKKKVGVSEAGLMSSWLKTGVMKPDPKRKSNEIDEKNRDSVPKRPKPI